MLGEFPGDLSAVFFFVWQIATDGTLVLTGLRVEEAGEYRCTASNAVGSASATANVIINGELVVW